jgi:hypothetical protein
MRSHVQESGVVRASGRRTDPLVDQPLRIEGSSLGDVRDPALLSPQLLAQNRMEREIALPYPAVLAAIDELEARGMLLLGWEALASFPDERLWCLSRLDDRRARGD